MDLELRLAEVVYSEAALLELLGLNKAQLARLRYTKGFPTIYLGRVRVYMAEEVVNWLNATSRKRYGE